MPSDSRDGLSPVNKGANRAQRPGFAYYASSYDRAGNAATSIFLDTDRVRDVQLATRCYEPALVDSGPRGMT